MVGGREYFVIPHFFAYFLIYKDLRYGFPLQNVSDVKFIYKYTNKSSSHKYQKYFSASFRMISLRTWDRAECISSSVVRLGLAVAEG